MTPDRKNSMNKQERAAGLLALCLLALAVLCRKVYVFVDKIKLYFKEK